MLLAATTWPPKTVIDAVAVPPEPESSAAPKPKTPIVNVTSPVGVVVPDVAFTVAVTTAEPFG